MLKQTIMEILKIGQCGLLGAFYACCFWGDQEHLDRFRQNYAIEKATLEARKVGHSVYEQPLEDGSVKLTITTGGGP